MLPLALPAIAALAILQFQGTWNDFFWPLILFGQGSPSHYTLQLGLAELHFTYSTLWPQIWPASVIAIMPDPRRSSSPSSGTSSPASSRRG